MGTLAYCGCKEGARLRVPTGKNGLDNLLSGGLQQNKVFLVSGEAGTGKLSSAKVISARAKIPYSRIHAVLYRLQQEELVISRSETPKLFGLRFKDPELPKLWLHLPPLEMPMAN